MSADSYLSSKDALQFKPVSNCVFAMRRRFELEVNSRKALLIICIAVAGKASFNKTRKT